MKKIKQSQYLSLRKKAKTSPYFFIPALFISKPSTREGFVYGGR